MAAQGLRVTAFATRLQHPLGSTGRPNGDVPVAESNTPTQPARSALVHWLTEQVMKRAGEVVQSASRITVLHDGMAWPKSAPYAPLGMALVR
ncbi:MAG: hypothetical protein ABW178_08135 [Pseudoxanthomonas sp.]